MKSSIFSFFSGIGMLDLGFEHEGFEVVFVNELVESFLRGYRYSRYRLEIGLPRHGFHPRSIDEFMGEAKGILKKSVESERARGRLVAFIGGPPCPDFSIGGKNRGRHGDNGKLSSSYVDVILKHKPDWFLFENVKGLWRTHRHRQFFDELKNRLSKAGYVTHTELLNSIEFGVPQDRDRVFLFGAKKDLLHPSASIESMSLRRTALFPNRSAFENYRWIDRSPFAVGQHFDQPNAIPIELTVEHWFRQNCVSEHPNATSGFKPRAGLKRFLEVDEGDDSRKSFKRLHRWRYSPTAAYGNNEVHLHPYEARRITAAEALAIQSAPASFALPNDMPLSHMFKSIGNAVPYLLAKAVASEIKYTLGCQNILEKIA